MSQANNIVKFRTIITFEVESSLNLEFFGNDANRALVTEREFTEEDPLEAMDLYAKQGTFTVKVEEIQL